MLWYLWSEGKLTLTTAASMNQSLPNLLDWENVS